MSTPVMLCQGYSSTTGKSLSTVVTGTGKFDGSKQEVIYTICKGESSVMKMINVKQSFNLKIKDDLGSIHEKMNFISKLNMSEKDLAIVVHARRIKTKYITSARFLSNIHIEDMCNFFLEYGDTYISSISTGGEYIGVYKFHTETEKSRTDLEAELRGQGILQFGTIDADFHLKLKQTVTNTQTQVSFFQTMLGLDDVQLPDPEDMVNFARKFPSHAFIKSTVLAFETNGYEHVVGVPHGFHLIASNRKILIGTGPRDLGLAGELAKVSKLMDKINEIKSIYEFYGGYTDPDLNEIAFHAKDDMKSLQKIFSNFQTNPIQDLTAIPRPQLTSLSKGMPQLQHLTSFSPVLGRGEGGNTEQFHSSTEADAYIENKTRITSIQMRSDGNRMKSLIVDYESTMVGKHTDIYGKDEGRSCGKLVLEHDHFIKEISALYDSHELHGLRITLDDDRVLDTLGDRSSNVFSKFFDKLFHPTHLTRFPLPSGSFTVGFKGSHSDVIHNIQLIYGGFQPAKWSPF
ncbi:hypothetical protein CsatB_015852 [Cannabis sativa]